MRPALGEPVVRLVMALALAAALAAPAWCVERNLIANGDFAKGAGNQPDEWRTESWDQRPVVTTYHWTSPANGGPGQVEINSAKPNDARYMQPLSLAGGWYYVSAQISTVGVPADHTGGSISVMEDGISSPDVHGDSDWLHVGFYLKIPARGADAQVACRLGGYSSLNTGRASFRDIRVVRVDRPPTGAGPTFDLELIRKQSEPAPVGRLWTLILAFIALGAVAGWGWVAFGTEPAPAPVQPIAARPVARKSSKQRERAGSRKRSKR